MGDGESHDDTRPFALAICTLVVLPWALKKMRTAASTQTEMVKWRTLGFSAEAPVVQKEQRLAGSGWARRLSWRNAIFAALLATEALLVQEALAESPVVPLFDPYAALELDASVEGCSRRVTQWGEVKCAQATVRAAYRKLARRYHPDKTTGDEAKLRFEDVVKAHAVLTNALAARNYAKYGHPDGYQGSRFGIALPAWAMPKHGKAMDMRGFVACFLVVVLLVPLLFYLSLRDPKGQRRARLAQRAQEVYLLAALGKTDAEADGLERALDMLTDPKGPSPALHADAVQASRLLGLALRSLQGEPVQGGARSQLSVEMHAALSSLDGASCAEAAAAAEAAFAATAAARAAGASAAVVGAMEAAAEAGAKASLVLDGASSAEAARVAAVEAAGAGLENTPARRLEYTSTEARSLLLRAYQRREAIAPCLCAELAALLVDVPVVFESFFQSTLMLKGLPYRYGAWPVLQVTQQLTQALSRGQPTALQAPHVTVERANLIQAALAGGESDAEGATRGADSDSYGTLSNGPLSVASLSVWQLVNLAAARRDALLRAAGFGATETADVCAFVKGVFPRARLDARVVVQGEESDEEDEGEGEGEGEGRGVVLVGDIVTVCVTLTLAPRGNATDKRRAALPVGCHAPQLPQAKPESWAVLVAAEGGGLLLGVRMAPPLHEWTVGAGGALSWTATLSCHADKAGERRLEAHAACSAYHDADVSANVSLEV
jgi:hypothetical protein